MKIIKISFLILLAIGFLGGKGYSQFLTLLPNDQKPAAQMARKPRMGPKPLPVKKDSLHELTDMQELAYVNQRLKEQGLRLVAKAINVLATLTIDHPWDGRAALSFQYPSAVFSYPNGSADAGSAEFLPYDKSGQLAGSLTIDFFPPSKMTYLIDLTISQGAGDYNKDSHVHFDVGFFSGTHVEEMKLTVDLPKPGAGNQPNLVHLGLVETISPNNGPLTEIVINGDEKACWSFYKAEILSVK